MPRALSNPEWAAFMSDNQGLVDAMHPGDSRIISWSGESVLVFIGANLIDTGTQDENGNEVLTTDVYLSDVSDSTQLAGLTGQHIAPPQSMLDTLPQAIKDTIAEEAAQAGALINQLGKALGQIPASILQPTVSMLTPVLIGALVLLGLAYLPRR